MNYNVEIWNHSGGFCWVVTLSGPNWPASVQSGSGIIYKAIAEAESAAIARLGELKFRAACDPSMNREAIAPISERQFNLSRRF